jgi:anti-sigma factor (TIGR02949 family)
MMEFMGMIRCEDALSRLWEFLDGELPLEDEAAVKKHLDVCNRCYPHYDFQRAYFEYARQVQERQHAPTALRRDLFRRILEQESTEAREP